MFLHIGMAAILYNHDDVEPFKQIDNTPSTERPVQNLVEISHAVWRVRDFMQVVGGGGGGGVGKGKGR